MTGSILLSALLAGAIGLMLIPAPVALRDLLFIFNLALAGMILGKSVTSASPLTLTTFPSLLLLTAVFRLSLSINATRAILNFEDPGRVIAFFGNAVTGNQVLTGLVLFLILQITQIMIVTKGAERVAEVAARFSLDALPGKQMSIDADLRAGLITDNEAKKRRETLARESRFFGAMDGAMKFIKGEGVATIIIALINLTAGVTAHYFRGSPSLEICLLRALPAAMGDALATQIPALLIALSAGFIITRPEAETMTENFGGKLLRDFFPAKIVQIISAQDHPKTEAGELNSASSEYFNHPIQMEWAPDLDEELSSESFKMLTEKFRQALIKNSGVPLPIFYGNVNHDLGESQYRIVFHGIPCENGKISPKHVHAGATEKPLVPSEYILWRLGKSLKQRLTEFMGIQQMRELLDHMEATAPDLVREITPRKLTLSQLTEIAGKLVEENISLQNLPRILETLALHETDNRDIVTLTEIARSGLKRVLSNKYATPEKTLHAFVLDHEIEKKIENAIRSDGNDCHLDLDAKSIRSIAEVCHKKISVANAGAVILTHSGIRRYCKKIITTVAPEITVLSFQEIESHVRIISQGIIQLDDSLQHQENT